MSQKNLSERIFSFMIAPFLATLMAMVVFSGQLWLQVVQDLSPVLAAEDAWATSFGTVAIHTVTHDLKRRRYLFYCAILYPILLRPSLYLLFGTGEWLHALTALLGLPVLLIGASMSARHHFPELFVERD